METVEGKGKLQLMNEGERLMFRNRDRDGVTEERGYSSERGEMSPGGGGGWKIARKAIDKIKTSRGIAGSDKRQNEDSGSGYLKIIQRPSCLRTTT